MKKPYRVCAFDMDGTLVNTLADIAYAANHTLQELGYPTNEEDAYRHKVGDGMRMLCYRALPEEVRDDADVLEEMIRRYHAYYMAHTCDRTLAYPGVAEMLKALHQAGVLVAVISNKPHVQTESMLPVYFPETSFFYVQGQSDRFARKPDPEMLLDCIAKSGFSKEEVIYVGDSNVDVEFARRAGVACVGAAWGFRGREELEEAGAAFVADTAEEALRYII